MNSTVCVNARAHAILCAFLNQCVFNNMKIFVFVIVASIKPPLPWRNFFRWWSWIQTLRSTRNGPTLLHRYTRASISWISKTRMISSKVKSQRSKKAFWSVRLQVNNRLPSGLPYLSLQVTYT